MFLQTQHKVPSEITHVVFYRRSDGRTLERRREEKKRVLPRSTVRKMILIWAFRILATFAKGGGGGRPWVSGLLPVQ